MLYSFNLKMLFILNTVIVGLIRNPFANTVKTHNYASLHNNSATVKTPLMASLLVTRHPELVSGSPGFSAGMLKQVQQDGLLIYRFVETHNYASLLVPQ